MTNLILKQIENLEIPSEGYVFIEKDSFFWGYNVDGYISFGTISLSNEDPLVLTTKNLNLFFNDTHTLKSLENVKTTEKMHILTLKSSDKKMIRTFVDLTVSFMQQKNDDEFLSFFKNLKLLFSSEEKLDTEFLQGLYGELLTILFFYNRFEFDLTSYYHTIEKMNFDFSIEQTKKVEVKTTLENVRKHFFKLRQLSNNHFDILVVSIMLEKDDKGTSLYELIKECKEKFYKNYIFLIYLEKITLKMNIEDLENIKYNKISANNSLKVFSAADVPKVREDPGTSDVRFHSDLTKIEDMSQEEVLQWLAPNEQDY